MRFTINNMPEVEPVDFIGGVFPRQQLSIVASEPGCGKTWAMLQFCADLSNRYHYGKFFGKSFGEEQRKCLMLIGDSGKEMIVDRINKLSLSYIEPANFIFYFIVDMIAEKQPFLLNTREGQQAIQNLIHYEKPDIVFFDTLISFMVGDENSAKEIGEIFIGLRTMAEEENCAVVLNHHLRKTQKGEGHRKTVNLNDVIGSSAMARLASLMLGMTRDRDFEERNVVKVQSVKTWYKEIRPFSFEILSTDDEVMLSPDYYAGNMYRLRQIVGEFAECHKEGLLLNSLDVAEILNAPADAVKTAMAMSPLWNPLTEDPNCDKFFVARKEK